MQVSRPDQSSVSNLLNSLKKSGLTQSQLQFTNLQKAQKVTSRQSKTKEQHAYRKANYEVVNTNMDKWVPIIKVNRQKQHLDFTQKSNNQVRVTFFPSNDCNPLTKRIQQKLNNINVGSQAQLIKQQEKLLESLNPEDAQQRMNQAKRRSSAFYEQIKRKRISKIKSKLYRRIKKRQREKEQLAKFQTLGAEQKQHELQKMRNKRIKQRISLKHKIKNKHIQDMMRFQKGDKNSIQNSINQLNKIRREQLQKLNDEMLKDMSQQYDDQNFRAQALKDLEQQLDNLDEEQNHPQETGLKFMDKANKSRVEKQKAEALRLRQALINQQDIEISSDQQFDSDQDQRQKKVKTKKTKKTKQIENPDQPILRKKFQKASKKTSTVESSNKRQKSSMKQTINDYINQKKIQTMEVQEPSEQQQEQPSKSLIKGINISQLKSKYEPKRIQNINMEQLIQNNPDLFDNFDVMENRRQFETDKMKQYEQQLPQKPKVTTGWDTWAGPGIELPKVDPKKQLELKLKQIQQIKRKRKDGLNQDVIIKENRNKIFARQYLVTELPYNYTSKQQFDYVHQQPVGQQWNSISNFQQSIKPKIKTKAGQTIQPIKMPKKIAKLQ